MQNQEKHPVDELFAKRLRELEKTPSTRAWDELQGRLEKKKDNRKGIIWVAAASIVLLLGCFTVWLYWQSEPQFASSNPGKETVKEQPVSKPQTKQDQSFPLAHQEVAAKNTEVQSPRKEQVKQKSQDVKHELPRTQLAKHTPKATVENRPEEKVLTVPVPQEAIAVVTPSVEKAKPSSEVTVVVVDIPEATVAKTQTVTADTNQPIARKAEKLWNAIKKAKKSELNLDKEAIVAWVKDRNTKN